MEIYHRIPLISAHPNVIAIVCSAVVCVWPAFIELLYYSHYCQQFSTPAHAYFGCVLRANKGMNLPVNYACRNVNWAGGVLQLSSIHHPWAPKVSSILDDTRISFLDV